MDDLILVWIFFYLDAGMDAQPLYVQTKRRHGCAALVPSDFSYWALSRKLFNFPNPLLFNSVSRSNSIFF